MCNPGKTCNPRRYEHTRINKANASSDHSWLPSTAAQEIAHGQSPKEAASRTGAERLNRSCMSLADRKGLPTGGPVMIGGREVRFQESPSRSGPSVEHSSHLLPCSRENESGKPQLAEGSPNMPSIQKHRHASPTRAFNFRNSARIPLRDPHPKEHRKIVGTLGLLEPLVANPEH